MTLLEEVLEDVRKYTRVKTEINVSCINYKQKKCIIANARDNDCKDCCLHCTKECNKYCWKDY